MLDALNMLSLLADGEDPTNNTFGLGKPTPGGTIVAFKEFEVYKQYKSVITIQWLTLASIKFGKTVQLENLNSTIRMPSAIGMYVHVCMYMY